MPGTPAPAVATARARHSALIRHRGPADPAVQDAARDLAAEQLAEHVRRIVGAAPPLTDAQRARIAALLRPTAGGPSA